MGQQIVAQPNGLYAIWSTVVDDFVLVDATPEEIIDEWASKEQARITWEVQRIVGELKQGDKPYFQFTRSFDECVKEIRERHGDDAESLRLLGNQC